MIVAAGFFLGATLLAWSAPALLRRITKADSDPVTVIWYWLVSIAAVLATYGLGVILLLLPGDGPADLAVGCWTALRHGQAPELDESVGATGLVVLLLVTGRFVHAAIRRLRSRRRIYRAHLNYLRVVGPAGTVPPRTLWLDHTEPLAYSLAGRPGLIVASTGLNRLPTEQVTAVISHERAHLRGRHHLLTVITDALAKALPFVPLFRQAPAAIGLLVELCADAGRRTRLRTTRSTCRPARPRRPADTCAGPRHGRRRGRTAAGADRPTSTRTAHRTTGSHPRRHRPRPGRPAGTHRDRHRGGRRRT